MSRWNSLFGARYNQPKARRLKKTVKLNLEGLEDRAMPSSSPLNPFSVTALVSPEPAPSVAAVASPEPAPSVTALTSLVVSTLDSYLQLHAAYQQIVSNAVSAFDQEIAPILASIEQPFDDLFGIHPTVPNSSSTTAALPPKGSSGMGRGNASGSGSGSSASTTHNSPNQSLNNSVQQSDRGSGSGSSTTTTQPIAPTHGVKVHPLTSGTGSGSGPATIYGNVWLDSDYDGSIDFGELGYSGAEVRLLNYNPYTYQTTLVDTVLTDGNGNYNFTVQTPPPGLFYEINVVSPFGFSPTQPGYSQINSQGYSQPYFVSPGGSQQINAGLSSMNVNVVDDGPNNTKIQDKVRLRDAIQAGNNGEGPVVTFFTAPNTALKGTILLQSALDPIAKSYDIVGPGANNLTIQGQGNAANPFRIFKVADVKSTISGLTIKGGYMPNDSGGGVFSSGIVKLNNDRITSNTASYGGGVFITHGSMTVSGGSISQNYTSGKPPTLPSGGGGIWVNSGSLTLKSVSVGNNHADNGGYGGGVFIQSPGTVTISGGTLQYNHTGKDGGGIYNYTGTLTLKNNAGIYDNTAVNQGGGMWLHDTSTTNFQGCTVASNVAGSGVGNGVYAQDANAKMTGLPPAGGLTDDDDPGGTPVVG